MSFHHIDRIATRATALCCALVILLGVQLQVGVETRWLTGLLLASSTLVWLLLVRAAVVDRLSARAVGLTAAAAVAVALIYAPASSLDVNSYAAYGRMVAVWDASPFTHAPQDFPADIWSQRVSPAWIDSPSVYGPLFNVISGAIMAIAGESYLVARLGFQLLAAGAYVAIVAVLWRTTRRIAPVAFLALNPIVLAFGINDAHCDMLVGLGLIVAAVALQRRHVVLAATVIGLAILIKISAVPAIAGLVVWAWFRLSKAAAVKGLVVSVLVAGLGFGLAGIGDVRAALEVATDRHSRFAVFAPLFGALDRFTDLSLSARTSIGSLVASGTVAVVGLALIWRYRKLVSPALALGAGLVAYQVFGAYTLAWYVLWALPALALVWRSKLAWVAIGHATWIAIAYFSGFYAIALAVLASIGLIVWITQRRRATSLRSVGG